jgi:hypothetical protein
MGHRDRTRRRCGGSTRANPIERVSVDSTGTEANGSSLDPALSADGRFVAFESDATNLRLPR